MRVDFLGDVRIDGVGLRPRARKVLAVLGAHRDGWVSPDVLADAVWGIEPPDTWPEQIRYCVWELRKALGSAAIETNRGRYRLGSGLDVDVAEFERLAEQGRAFMATGDADRASTTFARALGHWHGTPFENVEGSSVVIQEVVRLEELHRSLQEELLDSQLAAGEHRDVVARAEALVIQAPLRERRWMLLALAHYRCGNQAEALRALRRARATLVEELGIDVGPDLAALERAVLEQAPSIAAPRQDALRSTACPYKGLACYDAVDSTQFFGREPETVACMERLAMIRMLVLSGPSGSGKSSLARAGIVPALRAIGRTVVVLVPGSDPDGALTEALSESAGTPVVVVDQLEEVFRSSEDGGGGVESFLARLDQYSRDRAEVIVTVRSDYLGELGGFECMRQHVEQGLCLVSTLRGSALRQVIEAPAATAGLRLEPGLVDLLVSETDGEGAALPLLSHALAETWERRDGRVLTVEGYRATGGIRGAVARSAEQLWVSIPATDQPKVQSLLLRMVMSGSNGQPMRVQLDRRRASGAFREDLVDLLARSRLVTASDDTVELAHEAIVTAWPRLRSWIDDDRTGQRILHHLSATADGWRALGCQHTELYRGARLAAAVEWIDATQPELTDTEHDFVRASVAQEHSEGEELKRRAIRAARQNRRLRAAVVGAACLLVVALVAGTVAVVQRSSARRAQHAAAIEALASNSSALRSRDRDLAALLALEAYRIAPGASTESALLGIFTSAPNVLRTVPTDIELDVSVDSGVDSVYLTTADEVATTDRAGSLIVVSLATGAARRLPEIGTASGQVRLSVSRDETALAVLWTPGGAGTDLDGRLGVVDAATATYRFPPVRVPSRASMAAVSPDGSLVAVSDQESGRTAVYNAVDGEQLADIPASTDGLVRSTFLPDGNLVVTSPSGPLRVLDPRTGKEQIASDTPTASSDLFLAATADGSGLVMVGSGVSADDAPWELEPVLSTIDLAGGASGPKLQARLSSGCRSFALADAVGSLLCADAGGVVLAYDLATGQQQPEMFDPQTGDVCSVAANAAQTRLVTLSSCRVGPITMVDWSLDGTGAISRRVQGDPAGHRNGVLQFGFEGDLTTLVAELALDRADPVTHTIDAPNGTVTARFPGVYALMPSDDPRRAVGIAGDDGTIGWYNTRDRQWDGPRVDPGVSLTGIWARGNLVFAGGYTATGYRLTRLDLDTGRPVTPTIELSNADIWDLAIGDDAMYTAGLHASEQVVERRSLATGEVEARSEPGFVNVAVGGSIVIGSTSDGHLRELDADTLVEIGVPFPSISGPASEIAVDDDGRRLMVQGEDRRLRVYDVSSRLQLGDSIVGAAPRNEGWSAIRPDGAQVAFDTTNGIEIWDLDVDKWTNAACRIAGRNLTRAEWDQYLGNLGSYRDTCGQWETN